MKNTALILLALLAGLVGGVLAPHLFSTAQTAPDSTAVAAPDALTRIKQTGVLRCGYINYEPYFKKDPNTGKMSGVFYDLTNEMAKRLSLKVEWTEEVGWANFIPAIQSGRFDALCSGLSPSAAESREVAYTDPVYYTAIGVYARADDNRFDADFSKINRPDVRVSSMDGSLASIIAGTDFPASKIVSLPNMTDEAQMITNVTDNKADVVFVEVYRADQFMRNNPGKIKNIAPDHPIRVFPNMMAVPQGEVTLQQTLNTALEELQNSGFTEQVLRAYENTPGAFLRLDVKWDD